MTTAHTERRHCRVCNLELPTSATEPLCDDHADGQETTTPTPQPDRPMRVIHNGNDDPGDYYPGYHPRRHG